MTPATTVSSPMRCRHMMASFNGRRSSNRPSFQAETRAGHLHGVRLWRPLYASAFRGHKQNWKSQVRNSKYCGTLGHGAKGDRVRGRRGIRRIRNLVAQRTNPRRKRRGFVQFRFSDSQQWPRGRRGLHRQHGKPACGRSECPCSRTGTSRCRLRAERGNHRRGSCTAHRSDRSC